MICYALTAIFPISMLEAGARVEEFEVHPKCQISDWRLSIMRQAKDASINDMLTGGLGFPQAFHTDTEVELTFDLGARQEQRDLQTLHSARSY